MLHPEHGFCQQNGPQHGQLQDWYSDEEIVMVPICLNGRFVLQGARVLHCINKDKGD